MQALPSSPTVPRWERVPRNRPCPCGSGKKYKRCCLERDRARAGARGEAPAEPAAPAPPAPPPAAAPPPPAAEAGSPLPSTVRVEGRTLRVLVRVKPIKHMNARLSGDTLQVSVPFGADPRWVREGIEDLALRLVRKVRRRESRREEDSGALLDRARRIASRFPRPPEVRGVSYSETRTTCWGDFNAVTRTIRLSSALRHMPAWVHDSVLAHELAHAVHPDHGPEFWDLLHRAWPEAARAREFLDGVSWFGGSLAGLPPADRSLLLRSGTGDGIEGGSAAPPTPASSPPGGPSPSPGAG